MSDLRTMNLVGGRGYTGSELLRLLAGHPKMELGIASSSSVAGQSISSACDGWPDDGRTFTQLEPGAISAYPADAWVLALPNDLAGAWVEAILKEFPGSVILDLSADYRFDPNWTYGLPERFREQIGSAKLIANPGCYPTAITLALLPAVEKGLINIGDIIADAKSGVSGAGRKAALATQFSEVSESFKAYSASGHRHLPEITQTLNNVQVESEVNLTFVPHLVPMNRGIFATIYVKPIDHAEGLQECYAAYYAQEEFVDVMPQGSHPDTASVRATNSCRIALHPGSDKSQPTVILSVIDNLVKGAAGQAIQNMNIMLGLDEAMGLDSPSLIPG